MRRQIGLESVVRFDDLIDPNHAASCLAMLEERKADVKVNSSQVLDSEIHELLDERFTNDLMKVIDAAELIEYRDIKDFEESVLESSLIRTILSESHPHIGEFLHLPEIDPNLVRKYDKIIVRSYIKKCIEKVIKELNISRFEADIAKMGEGSPHEAENVQRRLYRIRDYILGLLGKLPEDPDDQSQKNALWTQIQSQYQSNVELMEQEYSLMKWATGLLQFVPDFILKIASKAKIRAGAKVLMITTICDELDNLYNVLITLKEIEEIVAKQDDILQACRSVQPSYQSSDQLQRSVSNWIHNVSRAYGEKEWGKRVSYLKEVIASPTFRCWGVPLAACFLEENMAALSFPQRVGSIFDEIPTVQRDTIFCDSDKKFLMVRREKYVSVILEIMLTLLKKKTDRGSRIADGLRPYGFLLSSKFIENSWYKLLKDFHTAIEDFYHVMALFGVTCDLVKPAELHRFIGEEIALTDMESILEILQKRTFAIPRNKACTRLLLGKMFI